MASQGLAEAIESWAEHIGSHLAQNLMELDQRIQAILGQGGAVQGLASRLGAQFGQFAQARGRAATTACWC